MTTAQNSSFAEARDAADSKAAEFFTEKTWNTVKTVAKTGMYVGVFLGTVIVITGTARAVAGAVFGSDK